MGIYLSNDQELPRPFSHDEDLLYNLCLGLVTDGVRGLATNNFPNNRWDQAYSQAHFATLVHLLRDRDGVVSVSTQDALRSLL